MFRNNHYSLAPGILAYSAYNALMGFTSARLEMKSKSNTFCVCYKQLSDSKQQANSKVYATLHFRTIGSIEIGFSFKSSLVLYSSGFTFD